MLSEKRNHIEDDAMNATWDVLVVGGGITGAAIFREAAHLGLRTLLVEQRDFAWGTSSRSSKLVHGGLRYLREGRLSLTVDSVHQRDQLLKEAPGLVEPLGFLWATYEGDWPGRWVFEAGLSVYDLLSQRWSHRYYDAGDFAALAPHLTQEDLKGGFTYGDAKTDDARLVLRLIQEATDDGGLARNYTRVAGLLRGQDGMVCGARLIDEMGTAPSDVYAKVVVNATGVWADRLRAEVGGLPRMRPLRGSHLIFSHWRLPVAQAVSFAHPQDGRPVFIIPWEGVSLVGTTDVDHNHPLDAEPGISGEEVGYLMAAVEAYFPSLGISLDDVVATYAGVRPVVRGDEEDPSRESRDHVVWWEDGLLTVTGGKLTTFRLIAQDAMRAMQDRLPEFPRLEAGAAFFTPITGTLPGGNQLNKAVQERLSGRYGRAASSLIAEARTEEMRTIAGTAYFWSELRWAARHEDVHHLDDLLLRRLRIGLLLPHGGRSLRDRFATICAEELHWNGARWNAEWDRYMDLWHRSYSLPDPAAIPDWKQILQAQQARQAGNNRSMRWLAPVAALTSMLGLLFWRRLRRK
jgi:glycerol-3-phosphate dehydrogenase